MCGIGGFLEIGGFTDSHAVDTLYRMTGALRHRGPDADGFWYDGNAGVGLAHTRLSIVDLSEAGSQPQFSASGRFLIVYNGEIYNHLEIRKKLASSIPFWRGHSDTETLLAAIEEWGIETALSQCVGMFAMAVWDKAARTLHLARDRMGEKPLYWGWVKCPNQSALVFGSELKVLQCHKGFTASIDREALQSLMRFGYVAGSSSIFSGIAKLKPGGLVSINHEGVVSEKLYWSVQTVVKAGINSQVSGSFENSVDIVEAAIRESVAGQMLSDVPLGAFLSGGIDSSVIVALMQAQSSRAVKTFSIGFEEKRFNEAPFAREVSNYLGTEHHELIVTSQDALSLVPRLPAIYDEPLADSSQLPTILLAQLTRQHVTVALSGDGGDELFGGYESYQMIEAFWRKVSLIPEVLRQLGADSIEKLPTNFLNLLPSLKSRHSTPADFIRRAARMARQKTPLAAGQEIAARWTEPNIVKGAITFPDWKSLEIDGELDFVEQMMAIDMQRYLPDNVLMKVDRAAMACSLETRAPLLDHRLVELAWQLPLHHKISGNKGKLVLRSLLERLLPQELVNRPKRGFSPPLAVWLRGPLREWAADLLSPGRIRADGLLDDVLISRKFQQHLNGAENNQAALWSVLMFQSWHENWKS